MNAQIIFDAIGYIDDDNLNSISMESRKARKVVQPKWWVAVAACVIVMLFVSISTIKGNKGASPFTITAYAMDSEGKLVGTAYTTGQVIPMRQLELSTGKGCYLFSVPLSDNESKSQTRAFSLIDIDEAEKQEIIEKYAVETGRAFFWFIPDESMRVEGNSIDIPLNDIGGDASNPRYILRIKYNNGEFCAQIN